MASDDTSETPVSRAIKRRKELQDAIKASMKELEKIEDFLRMYRILSTDDDESINRAESKGAPDHIFGRAGMGQTQAAFEHLVRAVLHEEQRPMQSAEIIEAFRQRGHPIGGNETRTAWNRLWQAKERGVLQNLPRYGYWFADEPPPEAVMAKPPPKRKNRPRGKGIKASWEGQPRGRKPILTDGQIKTLERWVVEGRKTKKEMAQELGGISVATVNNYLRAIQERQEGESVHAALRRIHVQIQDEKRKKRDESQG